MDARRLVLLAAPLTAVYTADDPLTPDYRQRYRSWSLFADDLRLAEYDGGGHFFARTIPGEVAALIGDRWEELSE